MSLTQPARTAEPAVDVSVVIPVLDEREVLDQCYEAVTSALAAAELSYEIVFVDDGSTDGSTEKMRSLAETDDRVVFVGLGHNVGQQRAMYVALGHCGGRAVITYDCDMQFHPDCLPDLARKVLAGHDIVSGVRSARGDSLLLNRLPSYVGRHLINRTLGVKQTDFGGVKAYSARVVRQMLRKRAPRVAIPAMAYTISQNAAEIPVKHQPRQFGHSKWSILSRMDLYLDIYTLYAERPFGWMMLGGLASVALSVLIAIGILLYKVFVSSAFSGLIIFFDVFLFAMGIFFFTLSIIGEFIVRIYRGDHFEAEAAVEEVVDNRGEAPSATDVPARQ